MPQTTRAERLECLKSFLEKDASSAKQRGGVSLQEYLATKSKEPGFPEVLRKHLANKHFQAEVKALDVFVASNGAEQAPRKQALPGKGAQRARGTS